MRARPESNIVTILRTNKLSVTVSFAKTMYATGQVEDSLFGRANNLWDCNKCQYGIVVLNSQDENKVQKSAMGICRK